MTTDALSAGISTFNKTFETLLTEGGDRPWRAGGRKSKALPNKEDADWWRANGPLMVGNYVRWRQLNPNIEVWTAPNGKPAIEIGIEAMLPNETMLKSYIDRVFQDKTTGELLIVDLKTGQPPKSSLQLGVYRLAIREMFDIDIRYGAYWMGREGTLTQPSDLDMFPPEMVSRFMRDTYKIIKQGIFLPNIGMGCSWCGVSDHCYTQNPAIVPPVLENDIKEVTA